MCSHDRSGLKVGEDVCADGGDVPTVLGYLLDLLPINDVSGREDTRHTSDLERRIDLDMAIGGEYGFSKRSDPSCVRSSAASRDLRDRVNFSPIRKHV